MELNIKVNLNNPEKSISSAEKLGFGYFLNLEFPTDIRMSKSLISHLMKNGLREIIRTEMVNFIMESKEEINHNNEVLNTNDLYQVGKDVIHLDPLIKGIKAHIKISDKDLQFEDIHSKILNAKIKVGTPRASFRR